MFCVNVKEFPHDMSQRINSGTFEVMWKTLVNLFYHNYVLVAQITQNNLCESEPEPRAHML
jgi:hypothetical protein